MRSPLMAQKHQNCSLPPLGLSEDLFGDEMASDGDMDGEKDPFSSRLLVTEDEFEASCARQRALLALMEKTGYDMLQVNGQRTYGPPPGWEGPPPPRACEVFVGKIPKNIYEDELVPLFERVGKIYEFRLMMQFNGENRGYAFVMYTDIEAAQKAIQTMDKYEIRPGRFIGVCMSRDNCRLFIGSIPKDKGKDEIMEEMKKVTDGVVDVIAYPCSTDRNKKGFAFVEYENHKATAMARRKLISGTFKLWGQSIHVNWARPKIVVNEEIMQRVRVLHVRNLMMSTTEETLCKEFSNFKPGCVERVKKLAHYAFIHYHYREDAITALELMNGVEIDGATVEVTLAKPTWIKDGSADGRRYSSRETAAEGGSGIFSLHRNDGGIVGGPATGYAPQRAMSLPHCQGSPSYQGAAGGDVDRCEFPLLPGTPLSPTSLQSLKQSQIGSAVSLLELYCCINCWSKPEYHLFSTPGQDGQLLLLYKVVIPSTQSTYIPDKLCELLDDAKELAAQTTLWLLDSSFLSRASRSPSSSPCPPLTIRPATTSPALCIGRAFASCL